MRLSPKKLVVLPVAPGKIVTLPGDFHRVRVWVGRPGHGDVHDHVLKAFSAAERKQLPDLVEEAADAVESLLSRGLSATQQAFNR